MMSPKRIKEIMDMLPKGCRPRLGGSANLYFRGKVDGYRDVDIVVSSMDGISLPFAKIEHLHGVGLNRRQKYCIDGREVDVLESLFPCDESMESMFGIDFEPEENVVKAKTMIEDYKKRAAV